MHCSSLFAPFLACVVPSFYSIFYCILCPVPACGCASERWHRSRCPQLNLFMPALPSGCLVFFFTTKKKTRGRVTVPPIALNRITLVCPHTCVCNAVLRAPPFKAPSKAHFLIPFKGLILLIFINNGWSIYRRRKLPYIFLSHFIPFYYHRQTHPFPTSLPSPRHQPRCALYPLPPHSLPAHFVLNALMSNHWSHSLDSGSFT